MTTTKKIAGLTLLAVLSTGFSVFAQTAETNTVAMPTSVKSESTDKKPETKHFIKMTAEEKVAAAAKRAADKKAHEEKLAAEKKARQDKLAAEKKAHEDKLAADKKAREEKKAAEKKAREERFAAQKKAYEEKHAKKGVATTTSPTGAVTQ